MSKPSIAIVLKEDIFQHYWETDWIKFLLEDISYEIIIDPEYETYKPRTILITSTPDYDFVQYCWRLYQHDINFGVILLSDEYLKYTENYPIGAKFILRNYYYQGIESEPNVHLFPIGYKQGFWKNYQGPEVEAITERKYLWSFAGTFNNNRQKLKEYLEELPGPSKVVKTGGWNSSDYLSTENYRDLLLETKYVPSPLGNVSPECFRTWEALEAGCVPFVEGVEGNAGSMHYSRMSVKMGVPFPPFPQITEWNTLNSQMAEWEKDPNLQKKCHNWWKNLKLKIKEKFQELVLKL
jgi:hypothetical protein